MILSGVVILKRNQLVNVAPSNESKRNIINVNTPVVLCNTDRWNYIYF